MSEEINKNTESMETTEQQLNEQKDYYLRIIADYENRMKRIQQDALHSLTVAVENIVSDLTPLIQDLAKASELSSGDAKVGIEMIAKNMKNTLKKYGIEEVTPEEGTTFDPYMHEAISTVAKGDGEEGSIVVTIQPGYKFKEKVLVAAKVVVTA